jgi:hypothetical protein
MIDELILMPFKRSLAGSKNEFLMREHHTLPSMACEAIKRREQPAWSRMRCDFEVQQ